MSPDPPIDPTILSLAWGIPTLVLCGWLLVELAAVWRHRRRRLSRWSQPANVSPPVTTGRLRQSLDVPPALQERLRAPALQGAGRMHPVLRYVYLLVDWKLRRITRRGHGRLFVALVEWQARRSYQRRALPYQEFIKGGHRWLHLLGRSGVRLVPEGPDRYRVALPDTFSDGDCPVIILQRTPASSHWTVTDEAHTAVHFADDLARHEAAGEPLEPWVKRMLAIFEVQWRRNGELVHWNSSGDTGAALVSMHLAVQRFATMAETKPEPAPGYARMVER